MKEKKDDAKNKDDVKEEKDNKVVAKDDEEEIKVLTKFSSGGFSKGYFFSPFLIIIESV